MPCNRRTGVSLPCQQLAAAQAQLAALLSGRQVSMVETPQLGRVEYAVGAVSVTDLQRLIADLQIQCAESQGLDTYRMRRRPISMEAEP